jgi:hypothetical protein
MGSNGEAEQSRVRREQQDCNGDCRPPEGVGSMVFQCSDDRFASTN